MRIVALLASSRPAGNTARLLGLVEQYAREAAYRRGQPLQFETLRLSALDIRPCRGCRACFDRGEEHCPLADDVPMIAARMRQADAVVFASPVFVHDVSGLMKTLIDRLAYFCHRPAFAGKCALLLATVGGGPAGHALRTMEVAALTWGLHLSGRAGFRMGALLPDGELAGSCGPRAAKAAEALVRAVADGGALRPGFIPLMMFRIQQRAWQRGGDPASPDHEYWQSRGWLGSGCTFYVNHHAGPLTVGLARLVGTLVAGIYAS